jgi:large subunit ribosomal protein L30
MADLRITLRKSSIGCPPDQKGTLRALGLKKIGASVVKKDAPEIRGMVFKVRHLVEVEQS